MKGLRSESFLTSQGRLRGSGTAALKTAFTAGACVLLVAGCAGSGRNRAALPPPPAQYTALAELQGYLEKAVKTQVGFGPRHPFPDEAESGHNPPEALARTAEWIKSEFQAAGFRDVGTQKFTVPGNLFQKLDRDAEVENIEVEIRGKGKANEIIVVGAHYDTFPLGEFDREDWCPNEKSDPNNQTKGANDNASGVATVLALARHFKQQEMAGVRYDRTIRFVAFTTEEPPFFRTGYMGSQKYAERCRARNEDIVLMITPETLGYYAQKPTRKGNALSHCLEACFAKLRLGCPDDAEFVAFLTNKESYDAVNNAAERFRTVQPDVPVRVARLSRLSKPGKFPRWTFWYPAQNKYERPALCRSREQPTQPIPSARWSDDSSFWQYGYKAFAITDTANLRYAHYHETSDTHLQLNFPVMAKVVDGVIRMVEQLSQPAQGSKVQQE